MMRAIIVEDERNSLEVLRSAIENFTEGIEIVGEARDVASAVVTINDLEPDVLFLDVELPDGKGFDIIDQLDKESYRVVFVTAYDDYAIKAIRYAAIDYLVKPLDLDDLEAAVQRLKTRPPITSENINFMNHQIASNSLERKIMVPSHSGYQVIDFESIVSVEADSNYVFFILDNGKKHVAAHSLSYYEDLLPSKLFYRIHKSHIINFSKVESVESGRAGNALLKNGARLAVAARRKAAFLAYLKKFNAV